MNITQGFQGHSSMFSLQNLFQKKKENKIKQKQKKKGEKKKEKNMEKKTWRKKNMAESIQLLLIRTITLTITQQ